MNLYCINYRPGLSYFRNTLKFVRRVHQFRIKFENKSKGLQRPKIKFLNLKVSFIILIEFLS
jgi:hypothetical protein